MQPEFDMPPDELHLLLLRLIRLIEIIQQTIVLVRMI